MHIDCHQSLSQEGVIEPSTGPSASDYVVVREKNGEFRMCIDSRRERTLAAPDETGDVERVGD